MIKQLNNWEYKLKFCLNWSFSVTEWQWKVQQDDNYQSVGNMTRIEALWTGEHTEEDSRMSETHDVVRT